MDVYILEYLFCLSHMWWNMTAGDYFTHSDNKTEPFLAISIYSFSGGRLEWNFIV